jgi:hypothetical protein
VLVRIGIVYYYSVLAVERAPLAERPTPLACVRRRVIRARCLAGTGSLVRTRYFARPRRLGLDLSEERFHRSDERLLIIVDALKTAADVGPLAVLGLDVLSCLRSFRSRLCNLGRLSFAPLLYHNTVAEAETVSHQHPSTDA